MASRLRAAKRYVAPTTGRRIVVGKYSINGFGINNERYGATARCCLLIHLTRDDRGKSARVQENELHERTGQYTGPTSNPTQ